MAEFVPAAGADIENDQYGALAGASGRNPKKSDAPVQWQAGSAGGHPWSLACSRVGAEAWDRGRWLVGLMLMQSTSSWIIGQYTTLLEEHMIIISFLTMLVGAGGNAGAQAAVASVRGIAVRSPDFASAARVAIGCRVI